MHTTTASEQIGDAFMLTVYFYQQVPCIRNTSPSRTGSRLSK